MMLRNLSVTVKGEAVLLEASKVQNPTGEKSKQKTVPVHNPDKVSLHKIFEGVVIGSLVLCVAWAVNHYLGIVL